MKRLQYPLCLLFSGLISLCVPSDLRALDSNNQPKTISTNLRGFTVPFKVENRDGRYIEVHLFVSEDRGKTWNFYAKQDVGSNGFEFSCNKDGEYWFALKTLDRNRQFVPSGNVVTPELSIIVDSQQPKLDFNLETDAAGRIITQWKISDEFIDSQSLVIQHRGITPTGTKEPWIPVRLNNVSRSAYANQIQDRVAWWPTTSARRIEVQLNVSDMAGNRNSALRTINLSNTTKSRRVFNSTTSQSSRSTQTNDQHHLAKTSKKPPNVVCENGVCRVVDEPNNDKSVTSNGWQSWHKNRVPAQRIGSKIEFVPPPAPTRVRVENQSPTPSEPFTAAHDKASSANSIEWKSKSTKWTGLTKESNSSTLNHNRFPIEQPEKPILGLNNDRYRDIPVVERNSEQVSSRRNMKSTRQEGDLNVSESTTFGNAKQYVQPPKNYTQISTDVRSNRKQFSNNSSRATTYPKASIEETSSADSLKLSVNTRRFNLNYGIRSIDSSGVGKVILWGTEDGGNTWESWATDPDNVSPFPVEVTKEGLFGFRIVINSKDGIVGKPPVRGSQPDVFVRVDLTTPRVEITSAPYGSGSDVGKLVVQWDAYDEFLTDRPIDLFYSPNSDGPWTTIARRLRNSGSYAWKVPAQVPKQVFLRIDAKDQSGNKGIFQLTQPLDISGLIPRGKIFGVEPIR